MIILKEHHLKGGSCLNDIEKVLIEKCKNGDIEAFEKLILGYQKKVFNLCYRYIENHDDASELAQEVFIKIYKSIINFKGESSLSTWIYKIAVGTCIDEIRKRKKYNVISIDNSENSAGIELIDNSHNPHSRFERNETVKEIYAAINELSEEFKTVIILRDVQGFSYSEISEIADIPMGTVKSRIKRARDDMKQFLLKNGNFFKEVSSN